MDDSGNAAGVREGDVLAGKYRIEKVLGVGGMGVVVAARHLQLETRVAIKFLLPEMLANKEAVGRFAREARAAVKITGEHVARVFDVGTLDTGAPYMVMELLEGGDLSAWLQQRGALSIDQALEFLLHACVAVAEAHSLGIIHRDLKPANLFCIRRADGKFSIKVLDFGISKMTDLSSSDGGMSVTKTSAMMGSPLYMSPEQMQSLKDVDAQTDIWALGVILFELLTTHVPFDGQTLPEVAIKVATQAPPPFSQFRPDIPPGLEAVVAKALEKLKSRRYKNVAELALAVGEFAPVRTKPLVERICGILQVDRPASVQPEALEPSLPRAPTVAAGTMSAVVRTTAGLRGDGKKRVATFAMLGAVGTIAAAALVVSVAHKRVGDEIPAVAAAPQAATLPPTAPTAVLPAGSPSPPPADISPSHVAAIASEVPRPMAPAAPTKALAGHPPPFRPAPATLHPPSSAPSAPPPPSTPLAGPAAPSPQHKNQLDLGNFQ